MAVVYISTILFIYMVTTAKLLQVAIWALTHPLLEFRGKLISFLIISLLNVIAFCGFCLAQITLIQLYFHK